MVFSPYRLLSLIFFALATLVLVQLYQGLPLFDFDISDELAKSWGAVLSYAVTVLKNSQKEYFQALMLVLFIAALVYCMAQIIGIQLDLRRLKNSRKTRHGQAFSAIAAFVLSRPFERFSKPDSFGKAKWQTYSDKGAKDLIAPIKLLTQVFPLLGFLGTIAGIASSLNYLPTGDDNSGNIGLLTQSLYTAFDTTFIGLTASFVLLVTAFYLESAWDQLANLAGKFRK
jgi:hypothetical protein